MSGFGHYGLFDDELEARRNHIEDKMKKNGKRDPIYLDWHDNHMVCDNCKSREPLTIPVSPIIIPQSWDDIITTFEDFQQKHEHCKAEANGIYRQSSNLSE